MFRLILFVFFVFLSNAYTIDFPDSNSPQEYIVNLPKNMFNVIKQSLNSINYTNHKLLKSCIDEPHLMLETIDTTKQHTFKIFNKYVLTNNNLNDYGIIFKKFIIAFDKLNNKCNDKKVVRIECNENFGVDFFAKLLNDKMLNKYFSMNSANMIIDKIKMYYLFNEIQNFGLKIFNEILDIIIEIKKQHSIQNISIEQLNNLIIPNYFNNFDILIENALSSKKFNSILKKMNNLHFLQILNITLTHFEDSI